MYVMSKCQIAVYTPEANGTLISESECIKKFGKEKWQEMRDDIDSKGSAILPFCEIK